MCNVPVVGYVAFQSRAGNKMVIREWYYRKFIWALTICTKLIKVNTSSVNRLYIEWPEGKNGRSNKCAQWHVKMSLIPVIPQRFHGQQVTGELCQKCQTTKLRASFPGSSCAWTKNQNRKQWKAGRGLGTRLASHDSNGQICSLSSDYLQSVFFVGTPRRASKQAILDFQVQTLHAFLFQKCFGVEPNFTHYDHHKWVKFPFWCLNHGLIVDVIFHVAVTSCS